MVVTILMAGSAGCCSNAKICCRSTPERLLSAPGTAAAAAAREQEHAHQIAALQGELQAVRDAAAQAEAQHSRDLAAAAAQADAFAAQAVDRATGEAAKAAAQLQAADAEVSN